MGLQIDDMVNAVMATSVDTSLKGAVIRTIFDNSELLLRSLRGDYVGAYAAPEVYRQELMTDFAQLMRLPMHEHGAGQETREQFYMDVFQHLSKKRDKQRRVIKRATTPGHRDPHQDLYAESMHIPPELMVTKPENLFWTSRQVTLPLPRIPGLGEVVERAKDKFYAKDPELSEALSTVKKKMLGGLVEKARDFRWKYLP